MRPFLATLAALMLALALAACSGAAIPAEPDAASPETPGAPAAEPTGTTGTTGTTAPPAGATDPEPQTDPPGNGDPGNGSNPGGEGGNGGEGEGGGPVSPVPTGTGTGGDPGTDGEEDSEVAAVTFVGIPDSVTEGGTFRVRLRHTGAPTEGCTVAYADSRGNNYASQRLEHDESFVVPTEHDSDDDTGRTITVSLSACDWDEWSGGDTVTVTVESAGAIYKPDTNTYTVNIGALSWSNHKYNIGGIYDGTYRAVLDFDFVVSPSYPTSYRYRITCGGQPELRTASGSFTVWYTVTDTIGGGGKTYHSFSGGGATHDGGSWLTVGDSGASRTTTVTIDSVNASPISIQNPNCSPTYYYHPAIKMAVGSSNSSSLTATVEYDE